MRRRNVHLICATVFIVLALQAFVVVILAIATGRDRHLVDEGLAAHIFQLLIVAQVPFVLAYLGTADWKRPKPIARPVAVQAAILAVTFVISRLFKL